MFEMDTVNLLVIDSVDFAKYTKLTECDFDFAKAILPISHLKNDK